MLPIDKLTLMVMIMVSDQIPNWKMHYFPIKIKTSDMESFSQFKMKLGTNSSLKLKGSLGSNLDERTPLRPPPFEIYHPHI